MPCGTVCHWWTCSLWDSLRKMRKRQFLLPNFLSFSLKHLAWWKPLRRELFPSGMWHDSSLPCSPCSRSYCLCHGPTVKTLEKPGRNPGRELLKAKSDMSESGFSIELSKTCLTCLKLRQCVFSQSFGSFKQLQRQFNGCVVLVKELQLQPLQIHLLNTAWLQVARTFPHQLTRKQLKLLDMCWTCVTCVTCGYCIWSNDAEQFAWYDIHLCNWLHQETVWNFSTDLDSWFRGWHCGCSAVSKFIQDVRESKLSQLIHTVGRIFGACDQAYLLRRPCSYPKAVATRLPGTSVTMSELLRASWQPTSPQIVIFDTAAFCIPTWWLRIRNSHLVMLLLSSSSLSHHFHLLWCPSTNRSIPGCCHSRRTPGPSSR